MHPAQYDTICCNVNIAPYLNSEEFLTHDVKACSMHYGSQHKNYINIVDTSDQNLNINLRFKLTLGTILIVLCESAGLYVMN